MNPGLRIGDKVSLHDDQASEGTVVMLSGSVVTVRLNTGDIVALSFGEFYDKTGDGEPPRRKTKQPEVDNDDTLETARTLAAHLIEVKTGLKPGSELPAPGYDPATTTVGEREERKVEEFAELPENHPWSNMGLSTLRRYRRRHKEGGVTALMDRRSLRTKSQYGRQDERVIAMIKELLKEQADDATVSMKTFLTRLERRVDSFNEKAEGNPVLCPSYPTLERILKAMPEARYAFGDSNRRRSNNSSPNSDLKPFYASRPGDEVQIDSTKLNCWVKNAAGHKFRPELTLAIDVATRSVVGYRLTEQGSNAIDAAEVLAKILTPEPFRPDWEDRLRYSYENVPHQRALSIDQRLEAAARVPVVFPNTIVIDNGRTFVSHVFFDACQNYGINVQRARPATGHDKAIVERFFRTLDARFLEHLGTAYTGRAVKMRGKHAPTESALYTLEQLDDLFAEFLVVYHDLPHSGLTMPWAEEVPVSPNDMYEFLVGAHGYLPAPVSFAETIDVLPKATLKVHPYGVEFNKRVYDSQVLNPYRRPNPNSADGKWTFRYHTDETRYLYFYDEDRDTVVSVPWTLNEKISFEFPEWAWAKAVAKTDSTDDIRKRQREAVDHLRRMQDDIAAGKTGAEMPRLKQHRSDVERADVEPPEPVQAPTVVGVGSAANAAYKEAMKRGKK